MPVNERADDPGEPDGGTVDSGQENEGPNDTQDSKGHEHDFNDQRDRFNNWMDANGFDKATNFDEEVQDIIDKYRIETGDLSDLPTLQTPESPGGYSLLDKPARSSFRVGEQVDPRAFDFVKLEIFAYDRGYKVTSALGGKHGEFSFHTDGRAVDVSVSGKSQSEIEAMKREFQKYGLRVYDETDKSNWTKDTTGFHLHIDTGTQREVVERSAARSEGKTRGDLGLGEKWPLRLRP